MHANPPLLVSLALQGFLILAAATEAAALPQPQQVLQQK